MENNNASGCPFSQPDQIDLLDPQVQEHCFDAYRILREQAPVHYQPSLDMYVVTRHADVSTVLSDPDTFINDYADDSSHPLIEHPDAQALYHQEGWPRLMPLATNLPEHRAFRALVDPHLTARAVRKREQQIRDTVNALIDEWIDDGEVEFLSAFAQPLPMAVIAEALGFPRVDIARLKGWSDAWARPFGKGLTREQEMETVREHIEFQHYIHETLQRKREHPSDDLISELAQARFDDPLTGENRSLTDAEIIGISDHLLTGGNETTAFALASGLWLLFRFPDLLQQLQADPSLIRVFVEEVLRVESPTQGMQRHTTREVELGGVTIPAGSVIHIRFGAANHDEARYPNAECPDLTRRAASSHFAFGGGEHLCPGAPLSRLEQVIAWECLLERITDFEPVPEKDDYSHVHALWPRALKQIHLRFRRR